jgi:hypothetical protein
MTTRHRHHLISRSIAAASLVFAMLAFLGAEECLCAPNGSRPDFRQLLRSLGRYSPDPCGSPVFEGNLHSQNLESLLFQDAAETLTKELNATPTGAASPGDRATETLKRLERASAEINAAWPEKNRFRFEILDIPPALVVKMTFRTQETFFVFGVPEEDSGKPNRLWREVGSDEEFVENTGLRSGLYLYPLHRSASGHARFLARFDRSGCAGSSGVDYDAREWDPAGIGSLNQIIKQSGAFGMDEEKGFEGVGELRTTGSHITLPYCWFSVIDTWDNPSLCAADTYDISGDEVKFKARVYNRPDLVPVAKAIEYAQRRDYEAVRGYCASSKVARRLVRDIPPDIFADELRVSRTGSGKEHIEFGFETTFCFDVKKHAGRWRVAGFRAE